MLGPGPGPSRPSGRARPVIHGVLSAWNEEEIIFATVRNLLEQGADRVFVIDDDSDDSTVSEAGAAGADIVHVTSGGVYDDTFITSCLRDVMAAHTAAENGDVWWIVVDADEFPRGPQGATIRELVGGLPPWVDVVGSRVLEHYPDGPCHYPPRVSPLGSLPLARWYHNPYCASGHWKHQLLHVREPGELLPLPGHHTAVAQDGRRVREHPASLLMHHMPYRDRDRVQARWSRRYADSPDPYIRSRLAERLAAVDDLYAGRFDVVSNPFPGQPKTGVEVSDWHRLVPPKEAAAHFP